MPQSVARRGPSYVLLVTLLVALAVGAAASLLIGAATSSGNPPLPASQLIVPGQFFTYGLLALGGLYLVVWTYSLFSQGRFRIMGHGAFPFVVALLLVIAALALHAFAVGGPQPSGAVGAGANNSTSRGIVPPPQNATPNGTAPVGNVTPYLLPGVPGWVLFVLVAGVAIAVAAVGVPLARGLLADRKARRRGPGGPGPRTAEVRRALEVAAGELETGRDPRAVIVGLYGELLSRLGAAIGNVDPHTPEEIRSLHLERLGIRHEAATQLTRLFEEARYSSHAMGEESVVEARHAIGAAISDLARTWGT